MITLSLPMPPSTNSLYRNVPGRGRAKTERYRTWLRAAGNELLTQRVGLQPIHGAFTLTILLPQSKRRSLMDASNYIKATEDLLVRHRLIDDDRNAESVTIAWAAGIAQCEVRVWPWDAEHAEGPLFGASGQGEAA
jgi:Holliday junction resolvase RusA-like endonuclease